MWEPLQYQYVVCFRMSTASYTIAHSIPPHTLTHLAREWLEEDTPNFDPAGVCVGSHEVEARLLCKTPHSILAGTPFFTAVFTEVGCTVDWIYPEGHEIGTYDRLGSVAQIKELHIQAAKKVKSIGLQLKSILTH